eukprot:96370-Karenia_brevis.AAC.1
MLEIALVRQAALNSRASEHNESSTDASSVTDPDELDEQSIPSDEDVWSLSSESSMYDDGPIVIDSDSGDDFAETCLITGLSM